MTSLFPLTFRLYIIYYFVTYYKPGELDVSVTVFICLAPPQTWVFSLCV